MPRIAAVCATAPGPNPGMAAVDLALHALVKRHGIAATLEFHQPYTSAEILRGDNPQPEALERRQALPFEYVCSRDDPERVRSADAIVYWGDFLHMEHYLRTVQGRLARLGAAGDEAEGRRRALEYFFLDGAPDAALGKALAFGGTLLFDRGPEACGEDYARAFTRFMRGASGAWMRDVYSALKVARARGQATALRLGTDCALLLGDDDVAALPRTEWTAQDRGRGAVGVFLGRSRVPLERVRALAQDCAKRLDARVHWLPWGTPHSFPLMRYDVRGPARDAGAAGAPGVGDVLELLRRYRVVISDTYHVCVNAWGLGVPAICIGQALVRSANNVNSGYAFAWRDKRQVFYAMHDALDFLVYAEELAAPQWRERRLAQLLERVQDAAGVAAIVGRIRAQARAAEGEFVQALKSLL